MTDTTTCVIDPIDTLDTLDATETLDTRIPRVAARLEGADVDALLEAAEGWQALALASRGALLTGPELAAAELLPVDIALDLLFPGLDDAARHEAMWALDQPAG
jgi:hypothetical protein